MGNEQTGGLSNFSQRDPAHSSLLSPIPRKFCLPSDLLLDIFLFLDRYQIEKSQLVCSGWNKIILQHQNFLPLCVFTRLLIQEVDPERWEAFGEYDFNRNGLDPKCFRMKGMQNDEFKLSYRTRNRKPELFGVPPSFQNPNFVKKHRFLEISGSQDYHKKRTKYLKNCVFQSCFLYHYCDEILDLLRRIFFEIGQPINVIEFTTTISYEAFGHIFKQYFSTALLNYRIISWRNLVENIHETKIDILNPPSEINLYPEGYVTIEHIFIFLNHCKIIEPQRYTMVFDCVIVHPGTREFMRLIKELFEQHPNPVDMIPHYRINQVNIFAEFDSHTTPRTIFNDCGLAKFYDDKKEVCKILRDDEWFMEMLIQFSETTDEHGSIFITLILACIFPYLVVLYVFITNPKFNKHYSYWIMLHLGIMDILQLITYFGSIGIMMLMNKSFPFLLNKILSSFGITTWLGMGVMTLILSINRFITLLDIKFPICIKEIIFYRILLISGYIFTTICLTIMFLPKLGLTINIMWFEFEKDFAQINLMSIFTYIDIGILSAALILYLITVGYLIFNRHFNTSNTRLIAHHELRLFFQAMFICVYKSVVGTMISFWIPSDNLSCAIFYCFALIESGYNPYLYFLTNRALRQQILQMFSLTPKNSNKVHVIAVSYKPAGPRNQSSIDPSIYLHIPLSY